jgi:hypothetical protein
MALTFGNKVPKMDEGFGRLRSLENAFDECRTSPVNPDDEDTEPGFSGLFSDQENGHDDLDSMKAIFLVGESDSPTPPGTDSEKRLVLQMPFRGESSSPINSSESRWVPWLGRR